MVLVVLTAGTTTWLRSSPASAAEDTTVIVNGTGQHGWTFNPDSAYDTPYAFSTAQATLGTGSLLVQPITNTVNGNADRFVAAFDADIPVDQFQYFWVDILPTAQPGATLSGDQFTVNMLVNRPGSSAAYDCRWDFDMAGYVLEGGWEQIGFSFAAATRGYADDDPVDDFTCPSSWNSMPTGSTMSFAVTIGDETGADTGIGAYIDDATLYTGRTYPLPPATIYDFEPAPDTDADDDGLDDAVDPDTITALLPTAPSAYSKSTSRKVFAGELDRVEQLLLAGDTSTALDKLTALRRKVDGCGNTGKPKADKDDWILDCTAQLAIRGAIDDMIAAIGQSS